MGVVVRKACLGDLSSVRRLYDGLSAGGGIVEEWEGMFKAIEARKDVHLLVAELDGVVVGTCSLYVLPTLAHGVRNLSFVEYVMVDEKYQRRGVGRRLMEECVRIARKAGSYKLFVPSSFQRERAHAFYEKVGFTRYGHAFKIDL